VKEHFNIIYIGVEVGSEQTIISYTCSNIHNWDHQWPRKDKVA